MKSFFALFVFVLFASSFCEGENEILRILTVKMADEKGAGMDGGTFRILAFSGGRFKIKICSEQTQVVSMRY